LHKTVDREQSGTLSRLSLYREKNEETRLRAVVRLTNRNWARLLILAETYNNRMGKRLNESDILNAMLNTYYKRLYNKYSGQTQKRKRS
jgi:hypothetical protein